jgi:hypothetical protein
MCVRVCGTCGRVPRLRVDVVVDASVMLADCGPMEPARVLRDRALPRDQECEHERVESGVVEALAEVAARRDDRGGPAAFGELGRAFVDDRRVAGRRAVRRGAGSRVGAGWLGARGSRCGYVRWSRVRVNAVS